jgi:hypothetical protein
LPAGDTGHDHPAFAGAGTVCSADGPVLKGMLQPSL